jgi:hypothetical protein
MITFQSRIIAEYCQRRFAYAEVLETFTFDQGEDMLARQALVLSLYPVEEIVAVANDGSATAAYELDGRTGRLWLGSWFTGSAKVAVTYAGGYVLPDESPARLQKALIEMTREGRTSGSRDPSVREVQHGDSRISYFTAETSSATTGFLSAPVVDLIRPYRRIPIA